jgi:CBS domain containing-hemolysin-like protein
MTISTILGLCGGVLLICTNAFFVMTEFALTRLRQFDDSDFQGDARLAHAWHMSEKLEIYLTGCQVGITFSSILLGVVAEPAMTRALQPVVGLMGVQPQATHAISVGIGIVVINLVHMIWAEQAPTYLGIERSKQVARYCALPHYYWTKLTYIFTYVGDRLAKATLRLFGITMERSWAKGTTDSPEDASAMPYADLKRRMAELLSGEHLAADRQQEVMQALAIGDLPTRQIMVPQERIVALVAGDAFEKNLERIGTSGHSRYPLIGACLEDFKGIVYVPELLRHLPALQSGAQTLAELPRTPMTVSPTLAVSDLIDAFQREHQELALVAEKGQVVGLVTLTDALEAIVGQAEDPLDLEADAR